MSAAEVEAKPAAVEQPQPQPEPVEVEIPDVIERLPKPDKAAHDAEIAKLDTAIKKLQARTVRDERRILYIYIVLRADRRR